MTEETQGYLASGRTHFLDLKNGLVRILPPQRDYAIIVPIADLNEWIGEGFRKNAEMLLRAPFETEEDDEQKQKREKRKGEKENSEETIIRRVQVICAWIQGGIEVALKGLESILGLTGAAFPKTDAEINEAARKLRRARRTLNSEFLEKLE